MMLKKYDILLLLLLTFFKVPSSSAVQEVSEAFSTKKPTINKDRSNKVLGGHRCPIEEHPFLVTLRIAGARKHFCAGTLISKLWVLTAMHCLLDTCSEHIQVIAGSSIAHNISRNLDNGVLQYSKVSRCYLYPKREISKFDISLIRLKDPILQAGNVGYVKLPFELDNVNSSLVDVCSNAEIMGWGYQYAYSFEGHPIVSPIPEYDPHLQCADISVISNENCTSRNIVKVRPSFFCAFRPNSHTCRGDSGGPLMCNGYQYGIVSHGYGCGFEGFAAVYTNVLYFKEFILTTIESQMINDTDDKSPAKASRVAKLSAILFILVLELYL